MRVSPPVVGGCTIVPERVPLVAKNQPTVTIETEVDTPGGWRFEARIERPHQGARTVTLRISWQDFEHWSGGTAPPSIVAQAVVELAIERKEDSANLGDFDAAMLRRWFPGADEALRQKLRRTA